MAASSSLILPRGELSKEELLTAGSLQEYQPWLLDDHPLRSYPTQCIPGLGPVVRNGFKSFRLRWKEHSLRAVCLILASFAAYGGLRALAGAIFPQPTVAGVHPRSYPNACIFPRPDTRPNALSRSLAAGCDGLNTALWLDEDVLKIGAPTSSRNTEDALQRLSLNPLLTRLVDETPNDNPQAPLTAADPSDDSTQPFFLILDAKSPLPELYHLLISHLAPLREKGYLTHWDQDRIVSRRVTVVVTGDDISDTDCSTHSYSDIFYLASPEDPGVTGSHLSDVLPNVSPICLT
ncbi:hypothetical protein N7474_011185 [Penicillium riverlandense]|uniref:uncharacterized protein n=1 Tax=Penicillium riverlandense TaxID=1903569 RepID=UPI0025485442|nr:uncharacterized protein N7474_011185 [Penicillium riverlandense]KAJ5805298.1 hypothetical protein N7474_011185 [Penicillium riverlandense]